MFELHIRQLRALASTLERRALRLGRVQLLLCACVRELRPQPDEGGNQRSSAEVISRGHQQRSSSEVVRGQALHPLALEHLFSASCAAWLALSWLSNMRFIDAILSFSDSRS
jgi:hypothetical protein